MSSDKFCLRWNEFENNISQTFAELRNIEEFRDVTLVCEDGQQVQSHKVILSASSPFFKNILQRNPHSHPLLYLKGVRYDDLQPLLNFMYCGEVNVGQDELNSFLSVAEDLKIKGLTQGTQTNNTNNNPPHAPFIPPHVPSPSPLKRKISSPLPPLKQMTEPYYIPTTPPPPKKKAKLASRPPPTPPPTVSSPKIEENSALMVDSSDQLQIEENSNLTIDSDNHIEIDDSQQTNDEDIENIDESIVTDEGEYESATVDAAHIVDPPPPPARNKEMMKTLVDEHMYREPTGRYQCKLCDRSVRDKCDARRHLEAKHFPNLSDYPCNKCSKSFRSANALKGHRSKEHKEVDYRDLKLPYLPLLHGGIKSSPEMLVDPLALPGDVFVNEPTFDQVVHPDFQKAEIQRDEGLDNEQN